MPKGVRYTGPRDRKPCSACGAVLPLDAFHPSRGGRKWHKRQAQCKKCSVEAQARWRAAHPVRANLLSYRHKAKQGGLSELPPRLVEDLLTDVCCYCGADPDPTNGIDRVDNSKGYTEDNVVTACFDCNRAKNKRSYVDFIAWVSRIYRRSASLVASSDKRSV